MTAEWAPASFDVSSQRLRLVDVTGVEFTDPFFDESIDRAIRDGHAVREVDLNRLSRGRVSPANEVTNGVAGTVFHVGRCGSTLLSRMLGEVGVMVVQESAALIAATAAMLNEPTDTRALLTIAQILVELSRGRGLPLILKFASVQAPVALPILAALDQPPAVLVVRDPIETVASMLDGPPGWGLSVYLKDSDRAETWPTSVDTDLPLTAARFYGSVWLSAIEGLRGGPKRPLVVDYRDLEGSPGVVLDQVLGHFSLHAVGGRRSAALALMHEYSKSRVAGHRYDPTGEHHRPQLSPGTRRHLQDVSLVYDGLADRLSSDARSSEGIEKVIGDESDRG